MRSRAASLCALVVAFACTTLPDAAQPLQAASPGTSAGGSAAARSVAAGSACGILEEDINDQKKTDEQRIAKQLYDTARLPQPFHGVLSSDVLPAEGLTRLTIDTRVNAIQQSCVMAFLVDETWGLKNLRPLHFRSVNVDIFKDTSGAELTRIFFSIPDKGKLQYYADMGVERTVLGLPSAGADVILPLLDRYAELIGSV